MPPSGPSTRRYILLLGAAIAFVIILLVSTLPSNGKHGASLLLTTMHDVANVDKATLSGGTIMPKLGNETAKAELGRAAWKLFHTIMSRYPDTPSADERTALQSYVHLFVRLYPCGECAEHFRQIVARFPPQVSSRKAAAAWACHVHNEVNKSLGKEVFDCANIGDFYDCGCADEEKEAMGAEAVAQQGEVRSARAVEKPEMDVVTKERMTGSNGRDTNLDMLMDDRPLALEQESWTRGG